MRHFFKKDFLNNLNFNQKFLVIYVCCVIIPLILTDGLILNAFISEELNNRRFDRENEANAYMEYLTNAVEYDVLIARAVDKNVVFYDFVTKQYESSYDYITAYTDFQKSSFFKSLSSL